MHHDLFYLWQRPATSSAFPFFFARTNDAFFGGRGHVVTKQIVDCWAAAAPFRCMLPAIVIRSGLACLLLKQSCFGGGEGQCPTA